MRLALVAMPFGSIQYPSIQIGLLKAIVERTGVIADTHHLNLDFAAQIGAATYEQLATYRGPLFGDWLFAPYAFDADADPDAELPGRYPDEARVMFDGADDASARLRALRADAVPRFLDAILDGTAWDAFDAVGFTSTFQQTVASLAFARRLKARFPRLVTIFGGANMDGDMGLELVRSNTAIDYGVIGEGDVTLPALLDALVYGDDVGAVPGVASRWKGEVRFASRRELYRDLDNNPPPDYAEYFQRAERLHLLDDPARRMVDLPFESSRGCWWGEKHHCTFCGLNGQSMAFRAKTLDRVVEELSISARRYRSFRFVAVDNIIDTAYIDELATKLSERLVGADIFYEIKANLKREQIAQLKRAGVTRIQPGIESLSTPVLRLMRKGISGIQNVNTLRWAYYYGMKVSWNVLWGFPRETSADYAEQARLFARLQHIPPPSTWGRIWLERFSPLYFDRESFPRESARPHGSYEYVYPANVDIERVAYFFDYALNDTLPDECYAETSAVLQQWHQRWKAAPVPSLRYWWTPGALVVEDTRDATTPGSYVLDGPLADAYHLCSERPRRVTSLAAELGDTIAVPALSAALDEFEEAGLMMREADRFLSLALPATPSLGRAEERGPT